MTSYSTFASADYLIGSPFWLSLTKNFEIYLTSFKWKNWSWQQSLIKVIFLCVQLSAFLWWFKAIHLINSRWIGANWSISFVQWSRFFSYSVTDATEGRKAAADNDWLWSVAINHVYRLDRIIWPALWKYSTFEIAAKSQFCSNPPIKFYKVNYPMFILITLNFVAWQPS